MYPYTPLQMHMLGRHPPPRDQLMVRGSLTRGVWGNRPVDACPQRPVVQLTLRDVHNNCNSSMTRLAALALVLTASAAVASDSKPFSAATVIGLDPARKWGVLAAV